MRKGEFIVFEGIDGAGKTTQTKLLLNHLKRAKRKVMFIHFPQYQTKSGGLIENYLQGVYGKIGPYQASVFYATDRFDGGFYIRKWLKDGYIVVADRYFASNIGHQGGKIKSAKDREKFFDWLYELEYKLFEIPKPTLSFLLMMPPRIAQKLTRKHGKKLDIHEKDLVHLKNAERAYLHAAEVFPKDFHIVQSMAGKTLRSADDIHSEIWSHVEKLV
jgi:dTMP kinase